MSTAAKTIALFPFARVIAAFTQFLGLSIEEVHLLSILRRYAIRVVADDTGREPRRVELLDGLKPRSAQNSRLAVEWVNIAAPVPSRYIDILRDPSADDLEAPDLPRLIANYALATEASRYGVNTGFYVRSPTPQGSIKLVIQDGRISAPEGWITPTEVEYATALCGGIAEMADLASLEELQSASVDLGKLLANGRITKSSDGGIRGRFRGIDLIKISPNGAVEVLNAPAVYAHSMEQVVVLCASLWAASVTQRTIEFASQFNIKTRTGWKMLHLRCLDGIITEQPTSPA